MPPAGSSGGRFAANGAYFVAPRRFIKRPVVVRGLDKRVLGVGRLERTFVCTFCAQLVGANRDDGGYDGAARRAGGYYNPLTAIRGASGGDGSGSGSAEREKRLRELTLIADDHAPDSIIDAWAASLVGRS